MRRSPVRSRSRPPNYFALRKPDAPSGFRRYETERVGLYSCEFRKAWDSRAVGRRFHSDFSLDSTLTITALTRTYALWVACVPLVYPAWIGLYSILKIYRQSSL